MKLDLIRYEFFDKWTLGKLSVNGLFNCYILENPLSVHPDLGATHLAIPYGTYKVKLRYSPRFHTTVLELCDVPGRTDIEIHPGNTYRDTHGCLLPGKTKDKNGVYESREAFEFLFGLVRAAINNYEDVAIEIQATAADTDFHSEVKQGD